MSFKVWAGLLTLFLFVTGAAVGQKPAAERGVLTAAEADRWAGRVRRLVLDGWTVTARGDSIVVERLKPVVFSSAAMNAPSAEEAIKMGTRIERPYRLTLRFAKRMGLDEYESLAAVNAASAKEAERLRDKVDVRAKFDEFAPTTPEEEARVPAYREAVDKLPRHKLPNLYTPDHSIYVSQSWLNMEGVEDVAVSRECGKVHNSIMRYFGLYDADFAAE